MDTIKRFYHQLNADNPDRFRRWRPYRDEIMTLIRGHFPAETRVASLLVLGAGNCDDIDLAALSALADALTLSDIDAEAMAAGVRKYQIPEEKVTLVPLDFLGFPDEDFFVQARMFLSHPFTQKDLRRFWLKVAAPGLLDRFPSAFATTFDIIVLTPVYTQFILPPLTAWVASIDPSDMPADRLKTFVDGLLAILPE
ncbi:MAG: hypothetical protein V1761_03165, partial [bacterium]